MTTTTMKRLLPILPVGEEPKKRMADVTRRYIYRGDRLTDPALRGAACVAVVRADGRCIRGRGSMLVTFDGEDAPRVVLARQLRKSPLPPNAVTNPERL